MIDDLMEEQAWPLFQSFMMGGFDGAAHRRRDRRQVDVAAATGHDRFAETDYSLLSHAGILTVRDSFRWHVIESSPGVYDWSSALKLLQAAHRTGTQIIWDLCHWGYPADLDIFSERFPQRFAEFAVRADQQVQTFKTSVNDRTPSFYCPINEISFWAWVGGDEQHFDPYAKARGPELKRQLARASINATRAILAQNSTARFIQAEPIIHISPNQVEDEADAQRHTQSQFEAWDMLAGARDAELGGSIDTLDILGVNYYWNNQWIHEGDRTPPGHEHHRSLHKMLLTMWERYHRPIVITETGAEAGSEFAWLGHIAAEVRQAHRLGVPVLGICIYPVMDYPGWDDDRHCECGLIKVGKDWSTRNMRQNFCEEVQLSEALFRSTRGRRLSAPLNPMPAS